MGQVELNTVAFVKISGEPVFVLDRREGKTIGNNTVPETLVVRRFVQSRDGSNYVQDVFTAAEVETEAEAKAGAQASLMELGQAAEMANSRSFLKGGNQA